MSKTDFEAAAEVEITDEMYERLELIFEYHRDYASEVSMMGKMLKDFKEQGELLIAKKLHEAQKLKEVNLCVASMKALNETEELQEKAAQLQKEWIKLKNEIDWFLHMKKRQLKELGVIANQAQQEAMIARSRYECFENKRKEHQAACK